MATHSIRIDPPLLERLEKLARERAETLDLLATELLTESLHPQGAAAAGAPANTDDPAARLRREKTRFISGLVHELRTPLGSMLMLAELLTDNEGGRLSSRELKYARNLHQATSDVLALISDVGFLNRIEAGRVEVLLDSLPVAKLASRIEAEFRPPADEKGLAFDVQVEAGTPENLRSDLKLLERILEELVGNAVHVTERGTVSVHLAGREGKTGETFFTLTVRDTGIALPEETLESLFEPFSHANPRSSRKFGGSGLGLAVARNLARLLGGELSAESDGGATTFRVDLPLEGPTGALRNRSANAEPDPATGSGK